MQSPTRDLRVLAILPAHNEADQILAAIESLRAQTCPVHRILVVCDNCDDDTMALAINAGADVLRTRNNTAKKSGALNQGLALDLSESELVLIMDADSILTPDFVKAAIPVALEHGAVSGAYVAATRPGLVAFIQKTEYAQERFKISRAHAAVNVLSGAATMFRPDLLAAVAAGRGGHLPGQAGQVYNEDALTEDFEMTLACKALGVSTFSPKTLKVVTDVMPTWRSLYGQRVRWQRGYLETLALYPPRFVYKAWLVQIGVYLLSILPFVVIGLVAYSWITVGVSFSFWWMGALPVFIASEAKAARSAGLGAQLFAAALLPLMVYNIFRGFVYWRALGLALRARPSVWT